MEELLILRELLEEGKIPEALELVDELEEMSKSDKLNKIFSYAIIVLLHLIKQAAEKRSTRSWETSILNSVKQIQRTNQRPKAKGSYFTEAELLETLQDAYESALRKAALEAYEGRYAADELTKMVTQDAIIQQGMNLILGNN
ncbi:DUF29 family protein [Nodularia chucula]|uniref:DUF29 family protein n=1 Tax=Nodularia chucula TaxID=3093667 RepID=UPI0039C6BA31